MWRQEYGKLQAEKDKFTKRTNELHKEISSHDTLGIKAFLITHKPQPI
jgi:hypothetical protein